MAIRRGIFTDGQERQPAREWHRLSPPPQSVIPAVPWPAGSQLRRGGHEIIASSGGGGSDGDPVLTEDGTALTDESGDPLT